MFSVISRTLVGRVLPICREAVGVFCSPNRLGHMTLFRGVLPLCREAVGVFCSPNRLGHMTLFRGVLPLCREAVGVFCSPNWLGHMTLFRRVLPLCREAVGVFCSPNRLGHMTLVRGVLPLCREAVGVFCSPNRRCHMTLVRGVLPLCREAVGVYYNPSRPDKISMAFFNKRSYLLSLVFLISSSSCRATSIDYPDPLPPPYSVVHHSSRSSRLQPVSAQSCCIQVLAGRPAFSRPCERVHRSMSLMSSSLLLQQCPACLVRLTWIVFVMSGK